MISLALTSLLVIRAAAATDPPVEPIGPADYPAMLRALASPSSGPPRAVTFRELWEEPERFQGEQVHVEGRVVRRFRQPAVGSFPALTELWLTSDDRNPFCVIVPSESAPANELGSPVVVDGVFLRLTRYRGGDGDRLAPLIVGRGVAAGPVPASRPVSERTGSNQEWLVALGATLFVVLVLGIQHLRKPPRSRAFRHLDRPPRFEPGPAVDSAPRHGDDAGA